MMTKPANSGRKEARLVAHASREVQQIIKAAAKFSGATVSQFLIDSAMERAAVVMARQQTLQLSIKGAEQLFAALESPPEPNHSLQKAAHRHSSLINGTLISRTLIDDPGKNA